MELWEGTMTYCPVSPCKCYLEDTVFNRQMAHFWSVTSFFQCSRGLVKFCPWSQVLIGVKRSETKVKCTHHSCEGCSNCSDGCGSSKACGQQDLLLQTCSELLYSECQAKYLSVAAASLPTLACLSTGVLFRLSVCCPPLVWLCKSG